MPLLFLSDAHTDLALHHTYKALHGTLQTVPILI
jgi:hypothetical protein